FGLAVASRQSRCHEFSHRRRPSRARNSGFVRSKSFDRQVKRDRFLPGDLPAFAQAVLAAGKVSRRTPAAFVLSRRGNSHLNRVPAPSSGRLRDQAEPSNPPLWWPPETAGRRWLKRR